jgi:hypothetical protein
MEVLDIGKKVFAVVTEYCGHALTYVSIRHAEICCVHVDREYRVTYNFDTDLVNACKASVVSCNVFDTREEALARARELINQNILQTIDGSIALAELFPEGTSSMQTVLPDDKAVAQCMLMDRVIRCVNDEENGIFDDWITLHVPDGCSRDEWADLIEGRVQGAYLEACEFFARRMSNLIAKGAWSDQGWTLELFNRDEHYFDDVVEKEKDEEDE